MTRRRQAPAWRQVVSLLAAFGAGAVLVLVGGALVPDALRLPDPPPALASPWSRTPDDASASRGGAAEDALPSAAPSATDGAGGSSPDGTADAGDGDAGSAGSTGRGDEGGTDGAKGGGGGGTDGGSDDAADDPAPEDEPAADDGADDATTDGSGGDEAGGDGAAARPDAAGAADATSGVSGEVLALVAAERAAAGCAAPRADAALDALAAAHAADMRDRGYFDHTDPDGRTPWDRAAAAGVEGVAAENIARGQPDAAAVMAAWMDSPGHRANILDCSTTRHGVARADGSGGPWWVQVFGR